MRRISEGKIYKLYFTHFFSFAKKIVESLQKENDAPTNKLNNSLFVMPRPRTGSAASDKYPARELENYWAEYCSRKNKPVYHTLSQSYCTLLDFILLVSK